MSYTMTYLLNGKKKTQSLNDFQASEIKRELFEKGDLIQIGEEVISKKTVQLEKDDASKVKRGDLRSDLNAAANACKICNRVGFIQIGNDMHPCKCQIAVKESYGKDGYEFSLYGDENVKTNVRLLEPAKNY